MPLPIRRMRCSFSHPGCEPKRQSSFIVHEVGLQNTNDMQDNRNECKDEPIQEAVSRTHHQEPDDGLDKVALVQLAETGNK